MLSLVWPLQIHQVEEAVAIDAAPDQSLLELAPSEGDDDGGDGFGSSFSDFGVGRKNKLVTNQGSLLNLLGGRKQIAPAKSIMKKGPKSRNRVAPVPGFKESEDVSSDKVGRAQ